jgi:ABC-type transport system involved in cytochrome bd biosynthesis fused ATPase/permease subunit
VTPATPEPARDVTFGFSARLLGALNAVLGVASSVLLAVGLSHLTQRHVPSGIGLLLGVLGIRWALSTSITQWSSHAGATLRARWRATLVGHLTRPQPEGERGRGDLALAIEQASDRPMLELLETSAVVALAGLGVLFWSGGWLATLITLGLLVIAVPLYRRAGQRSEATALAYRHRRAVLESRQLELLHHTTELRALGAVDYGADEIAAISDSEHTLAIRAIRVALESSLVTEFLSGVSIGLVAMVVGFALLGGRISLEHALIAVLVTSEIFVHVRRYGVEFHRREDSQRSLMLLDNTADAPSALSTQLLVATDLVTAASHGPVNLTLETGQSLLVTGPSGSGKTTLLDTLIGWRDANSGTVARARLRTGHVSVESALLSGTLRDNLVLGQPIADHDVHACLTSLGLLGPRFEELDTELLADGKGFSTGEKVRLVLARALLAQPALLVIDDVAGVLDEEGRRLVRAVLGACTALSVIEATVDTPLFTDVTTRIELGP